MSAPAYTRTAIALHWAAALLICCSFPLGLYMVELKLSPTKLKLYSYHKWLGVTVFLIAAVRIAWRFARPAPALPATMPAWQRHVAGATHVLLYLFLVAVPVSGWLMSSALGFQTVYLGLVPLPDLLAKNKELGESLKWLHMFLTYSMAAMVAAHVAAALKHHFVDRDEVLVRMLPFLARKENSR